MPAWMGSRLFLLRRGFERISISTRRTLYRRAAPAILLPYPYPEGKDYPPTRHLGYQLEYNTRARSERMPRVCATKFFRPTEVRPSSFSELAARAPIVPIERTDPSIAKIWILSSRGRMLRRRYPCTPRKRSFGISLFYWLLHS